MRQQLMGWVAVVIILLASSPVWSDEDQTAREATKMLDEIVVTAGRSEEVKADVSMNIDVLTAADIEQSAAVDFADLMADQGFMVREYPNSLMSVMVRGFSTDTHGNDLANHVLILINGRRAGTGNIAQILLDNVERVEIIRGPGSVQYGASAMGGVINVITKKGRGKPAFSLEQTIGSWNYQKTSAAVSAKIENFDLAGSISRSSQDDYDTADGDKYDNTGFDKKEEISLNAGWTFMPGNRVGLTYTSHGSEEVGNPNYISQNDPDDYVENSLDSFDLVYDGRNSDESLAWTMRYFQGEEAYDTYDPAAAGDVHSYFRDTDHQGAQAQLTYTRDWARITAGADWTYYEIENTYTIAGKDNTYDNPAAFVLAKANLLDDSLILSAGGRYDSYEVEGDEPGQREDDTNWSSNLGAVYKFGPGVSVRVNYAEAFRMPTADELYMFDDYSAWGFGIWSGNPDLKPEKSQTYEIGLDVSKNCFSGGLTWFYTDFEDKISYAYDDATGVTIYNNIKGATVSGVEGTLRCDIGAAFDWAYELQPYLSFTCLTEREDETSDEDLSYTPAWTASYGIRVARPDAGFESRLNFMYNDQQDITDYEGTGDTDLSSYTIVDLAVSKKLLSFDKIGDLTLKIDIRNLFNQDHEVIQGWPMPGRTFYAGLRYDY